MNENGELTGGLLCFSSSLGFIGNHKLPEGTPEAGKDIITKWNNYSLHGLAIVGYHDSIRYDLNEDGQYTNHIDINGDGIVDVRDWEIGGTEPYTWHLPVNYSVQPGTSHYEPFTDIKLNPSSLKTPIDTVILPFSFPFSGEMYDTLYINLYGMIQFAPDLYPIPYLCSPQDMLRYISALSPAFSQDFRIHAGSVPDDQHRAFGYITVF